MDRLLDDARRRLYEKYCERVGRKATSDGSRPPAWETLTEEMKRVWDDPKEPKVSAIANFFSLLLNLFRSDKAKRAFEQAAAIVPVASEIVKTIAALTPNKTDDEVAAAFEHYGVPLATELAEADPGAALLHLATVLVAERVPAGTPKNITQTAIQVAVTALKADPDATVAIR